MRGVSLFAESKLANPAPPSVLRDFPARRGHR